MASSIVSNQEALMITADHDLLSSLDIFNVYHLDTCKGVAEEIYECLVTFNGKFVSELTHHEIRTVWHFLVQRAVRDGSSSDDQECDESSFTDVRGPNDVYKDDTGKEQRGVPNIDGENDVKRQAVTTGGGTGLKRVHDDILCPRDHLDLPIKKRRACYTTRCAQQGRTGKETWLGRPECQTPGVVTNHVTSMSKPFNCSSAIFRLFSFTAALLETAKDRTSSIKLIETFLEVLCLDRISESLIDTEIELNLFYHLWGNVLSGLDCCQFLGAVVMDIENRPDRFRTHMKLGPIYLKLHLLTLLLIDRTLFLVDLAGADFDGLSFMVISLCAFIVMFEVGRLDILNFYINIDTAYVSAERWVDLQQTVSDSVFHCIPRLGHKSGPQLERSVVFVNGWLHRSVRESSPSQQCRGLRELGELETALVVDCCERQNCLLLKVVVLFLYGSVEQFTAAFHTLIIEKVAREKEQQEKCFENIDNTVVKNLVECLMTLALFRREQFQEKIATLLVLTPVNMSDFPVSFENCCSSTLSTVCSENVGNISEEGRNKLLSWGVVFLLRQTNENKCNWNSLIAMLCCIDQPDVKLLDLAMCKVINSSHYKEMLDLVPLYWKPGLGLREALNEVLHGWHKPYRWETFCALDRYPLVLDRVLERMDLTSANETLAVFDAILFSKGYSRRSSRRDLGNFSRNTLEEKAEMVKAWLNHGGTSRLRGLCACQRLERGRPRSACSSSNILLRAAKAGLEKSLVELLYEAGVCHPGCVRRQCKIIQKQKKPLSDVKEYCMNVWSSKVRTLQETCRIVLNDQIHCGPRRVERLWHGLPLPNNLKRYLLFHSRSELIPPRPVFDLSEICPDSTAAGGPPASLAQDDDDVPFVFNLENPEHH